MGVEKKIRFEEDGRASEPCCWNCKDFTVCLGGEPFCVRQERAVDRGDLCDCWLPRDPCSVISNDAGKQTAEPAPEEPSSISVASVVATLAVGLIVFVLVRHGGGWVKSLERWSGLAESIWIGLLVLLGLGVSMTVILLVALISERLERGNQGFHGEGGRVKLSLRDSLRSDKTVRMAELLATADGSRSLACENEGLFADCEPWESLVLLALVYERVAALLHKAMAADAREASAARALARAANLIEGVPEHEENVPRWRTAPSNLDWCSWTTVARAVAGDWGETAVRFLEAAEVERAGRKEADKTVGGVREEEESRVKTRKCIKCDAAIPEGRLRCPSCGGSRFIWE